MPTWSYEDQIRATNEAQILARELQKTRPAEPGKAMGYKGWLFFLLIVCPAVLWLGFGHH